MTDRQGPFRVIVIRPALAEPHAHLPGLAQAAPLLINENPVLMWFSKDLGFGLGEFSKRREFAWKKLNSIPGISCVNAKGVFYLFPNIAKTGLKSSEFCAKLLEQEKVAAVPGIAFGADDYLSRLTAATWGFLSHSYSYRCFFLFVSGCRSFSTFGGLFCDAGRVSTALATYLNLDSSP